MLMNAFCITFSEFIRFAMFLFLNFLFFEGVVTLPAVIRIGGIFGQHEESQELAFRYAVEGINWDRRILPNSKLQPTIINLQDDDSFYSAKKVCELTRSGVAAIFGPKAPYSSNHVQSICDALQIPHIETHWKSDVIKDTFSINLYPHPRALSTAYYDVIKTLGWTSFTILYSSNCGLIRLQSLLKVKAWKVVLRQLEGDDWRPLLKELKKSKVTKLVIDMPQEKISSVLKQALQIGLMNEYFNYFITSLDMNLVNMTAFRKGGSNITALRLIDPTKEGIQELIGSWSSGEKIFPHKRFEAKLENITTESALMYDAVNLFARALDDLGRSNTVDIVPLHCDVGTTWSNGNSLMNLMKWYSSHRYDNQTGSYPAINPLDGRPILGMDQMTAYQSPLAYNRSINFAVDSKPYNQMTKYGKTNSMGLDEVLIYGLTGLIKFDHDGFRSDFELQITELDQKKGMTKVGTWTLAGGANYSRTSEQRAEAIALTLKNRTIIVSSALASPYIMRFENATDPISENELFEGFCIDILDRVSTDLGFSYKVILSPGNKYGSLVPETGDYNGMIGELLNHRADIAIVDFTITYEREQVVDFSMPFMNLGIGIMFKKPQKKIPKLFSFMSPFSVDVWIYMATSYLGVSVLLYIIARITPTEWDNPHPCDPDPDELENTITLNNAFWFTIGSLMQQGSDIAPKAASTRIVASIWWFFTLIMISSYTANLAAFLTAEQMDSPIRGAEDLIKQSKIKYGCKEGGSTSSFFKNTNVQTYKRMFTAMSNAQPTVFMKTNDDGVKRVASDDGAYAFLMESSSIEYEIERNCDLMQVGGLLDAKSYGIALPPGSPYSGAISSAILKLKESGELHEIKTKWWKERRGGGKCQVEESAKKSTPELELANVGGVFVVLIGGMAISAFLAFIEFFWNARELATDENATFCEELGKEVKFIMKCSGNTRPIRKPAPSTPEEPLFTYGTYN